MGLSVPAYFEGYVTDYSPGAAEFLAPLSPTLRGIIESIGKTGMAVAAIIGITLDNVVPGTPEERGIKIPSLLVPEGGDLGADEKE